MTEIKPTGKKFVILTASPQRDKLLDELMAEELRARGHEAHVYPCLREGRKACLDIKPDVVVVPPIRNPYSRDFVETLKYHGCGVVSRHTEASCDWPDYKAMDIKEKQAIMGSFPYKIDKELVWGPDEADILSRRKTDFPVISVGSFSADKYLNKGLKQRLGTRKAFDKRYGFEKGKTLLVTCAWGFADSAPDLNIEETAKARKDNEGRARHIDMIKKLKRYLGDEWDILLTIHPGVMPEVYSKAFPDIPLDTSRSSIELMTHCDAMVHSGSTMGIGAHLLKMPAFQYQDVNCKLTAGWFCKQGTPLSRVSPGFETSKELADAILQCTLKKSNADKDAVKELVEGRYGLMDGKAYIRAVDEIEQVEGKWTEKWSRPIRDYDQPMCKKDRNSFIVDGVCNICGSTYAIVKREWFYEICKHLKIDKKKVDEMGFFSCSCPSCCSKFFLPWEQ
jgi:hypothetical protein